MDGFLFKLLEEKVTPQNLVAVLYKNLDSRIV